MTQLQALAKILIRLVLEKQNKVVEREAVRLAWLDQFPESNRQVLMTEGAKVRRRRKTYLAGSAHHAGRSAGTQAARHVQRALIKLEDLAVVRREGMKVRVTDVPLLVAIADGEPHAKF